MFTISFFSKMFSILDCCSMGFLIGSGWIASLMSSGFFNFSPSGNAYFHIILSWDLNGIAKSLMFLRATRVEGSSFSSVRIFFPFNFKSVSFSTGFKFPVCSSSFCSWPERR